MTTADKTPDDFKGEETLEVWDFRLSTGSPKLFCNGEFWVVKICANKAPDGNPVVLEEHVTDVKATGNPHDKEGIKACFTWLHSVRDKYSREHIELRKPIAKVINEANARAVEINNEAMAAQIEGNIPLSDQKIGELKRHQDTENARIKAMTKAFHKQVAEIAEGGA